MDGRTSCHRTDNVSDTQSGHETYDHLVAHNYGKVAHKAVRVKICKNHIDRREYKTEEILLTSHKAGSDLEYLDKCNSSNSLEEKSSPQSS